MYCSEVSTLSENYENTLALWERKILSKIYGQLKEDMHQSTDEWSVEKRTLSQKLEKEDYHGRDMWKEYQKKEMQRKCLRIPQKEKGPLEIQ